MLVVALVSTATACSTRSEHERGASARQSSAIIRGAPSGPEHDAAVLLTMYAGDHLRERCTGTLVAPNLVLTARHCTTETDNRTISCSADGAGDTGGTFGSDRAVTAMLVYTGPNAAAPAAAGEAPAARGERLVYDETARNMCGHDVAFIILDRRIEGLPRAPIRLSASVSPGETLSVVGYGLTEEGKVSSQRLARQAKVLSVGPDTKEGLAPNEYLITEGDCKGDSGGPAFDGMGAVVGVLSRGGRGETPTNNAAQGCVGANAVSVRTNLHGLRSLVERAFALSGNPLDLGSQPKLTLRDVVPAAREVEDTSERDDESASPIPPRHDGFDGTEPSGCNASARAAPRFAAGGVLLAALVRLLRSLRGGVRSPRPGRSLPDRDLAREELVGRLREPDESRVFGARLNTSSRDVDDTEELDRVALDRVPDDHGAIPVADLSSG